MPEPSVKRFGGAVNYAQFDSNGFQRFFGNARNLKELSITAESLAPGVSGALQTLLGHFSGWAFTIGDDMIATFEVPHDWDETTDIEIIVYWYINEAYATNSGEVRWQIDWGALVPDATEAVDAPTDTGTDDSGDLNIPAMAKYLTQAIVCTISATDINKKDLIGFTLSRIALVAGNDPTAEPVVTHIEIHYTSNKLGEEL